MVNAKQKRVVFFVYSKEETNFALQYKDEHLHETVKIITASLSAQLVHFQVTGKNCDYSELYKNDANYFNDHIQYFQKKVSIVYKHILDKFNPFYIHNVNIFEVMRLLIQNEILDVILAADLYSEIKKNWQPDWYYFPSNLSTGIVGWESPYFASAAIIKDFLCDKKKLKFFQVKKFHVKENPFNKIKVQEYFKKTILFVELLYYRFRDNLPKYSFQKVDILLFSGGHNLYYHHHLFDLVKKRGGMVISILTAPQSVEDELLLRKENIRFVPLDRFATDEVDQETEYFYEKFLKYLEIEVSNPRRIHAIFPHDFSEEMKKAIFYKIYLVLKTYSYKFIRQTSMAYKAIKNKKPSLVVTTHDPGPSALPFVFTAKDLEISTLVLLHGFHAMSYAADHSSDYVAAWGKIHKERFAKELQKNPHSIFTVGFPFLDAYFVSGGEYYKKVSLRKDSRVSPFRLGVLLTIYPGDQLVRPKFLFDLFAAVSTLDIQIEIQLRVHPGQHVDAVSDLAQKFGVRCIFNESISLDQFIKQNDVILSWDTTAILWAMIYHKPILYTSPWWSKGWIPVSQYRAAWLVTSPTELIYKLTQIYNKPDTVKELYRGQGALLKDALGVVDGTSSEKLFSLLKKLSQRKSNFHL